MKIKNYYFLLILAIIISSCSNDDSSNQSSEFRFLEFEKDVLLPAVNSREISFFGLDFDTNLSVWELTLVNEDNESFPVNITSINNTVYGFKNGERLQEIKFNAPAFGNGDYSIAINNKSTGQTYTDTFLVRSDVFNKMNYEYSSSYNLSSSSAEATRDLYYFHNIPNVITSAISTKNIVGISLQNTSTFTEIGLDYSVNTGGKVEFVIPSSVSPGSYYLSVKYNNLIDSYFEKDILVLEAQLPAINSISKNTFKGGESMIITGKNFRYKVNFDLLPINDLFNPYPSSGLIFKSSRGVGEEFLSPFESDASFNYINAQGTEINFPIPSKQFFKSGTDDQGDFFDGEVIVRSGPYLSEPISVRINYY